MIDRTQYAMRQRVMPDHMTGLGRLEPATLRGAAFAVVEIADVAQVDSSRGEDNRTGEKTYEPSIVLVYKEFPKHVHWLNKMGVNILCDVFGDNEKEWIGKQIPIFVKEDVKNPKTKKLQDMVWVADAADWERIFEEDETARKNTTAVPAKNNAAAQSARDAAARRAASKA
jgi:hypothetical protein